MKLTEETVKKLNAAFNKHAGKEVAFIPQIKMHEGNSYTLLVPSNSTDPTIVDLLKETGYSEICFILKDSNYVTGAEATYPKLQAFIEQDKEGRYHITKHWNRGMRSKPWL